MKLEVSKEQSDQLMARSAQYRRSRPKITLNAGDRSIKMDAATEIATWRVLSYFSKEPETIAWIAAMPRRAVFYDVGANIGLFTVWAAVTRQAKVYAFEPEAGNFALLNENLRANSLTDLCLPFCVGVSDTVGLGEMQVRGDVAGLSGHQVQVTEGQHFGVDGPSARQGISTVTLDHLVYERGFDCPSHLKVDVDGLEHAIIKGADRLLADPRLKSVMIELMVKHRLHADVIGALVDYGFEKDAEMEAAVLAKDTGVKFTGNILFTRP